jgi:cellulose synthase/poly-beta-1,6-N-acetylglucosamine synthase-like glycosyltransferase
MFFLNGFVLNIVDLILLGILFISFNYQIYFYLKYISIVIRNNKREKKGKLIFNDTKQPVSVIISAKNELNNLRNFLPQILMQDYPDYEVIVVNDGGDEETDIYLKDLKENFPHLRTTFVPNGAKNLSTKKLALTLGIKAAKHDWLLFTDADCVPESNQWIAKMARNFTGDTEFVLGYGAYYQEKGFLNKLITYDTLYNGLLYLGFAKAGKPYMGVGRNMAYRKEVFFRQNGFAATLHLRSGDDDLMVNHAANCNNTRIETSPESVTSSIPKKTFWSWYYQKERHLSVSTFYTQVSKYSLVVEPIFRGLFYSSFLALLVYGLIVTNFFIAGIALLLFIVRFFLQMTIINKSSAFFKGRKYHLCIVLLDMFLPLFSAYILTFGRMRGKAKYITWK